MENEMLCVVGSGSPAFRYSPHPDEESGFRAAAAIRFIFERFVFHG